MAGLATRTQPRIPLTVVVPTLNEGAQIADAIDALPFADEVIVADGGSTDDTVAIARGHGHRACRDDYRGAAQRRDRARAERVGLRPRRGRAHHGRAVGGAEGGGGGGRASRVSRAAHELLPRTRAAPRPVGSRLAGPFVHPRAPVRSRSGARAPRAGS